MSNTFFRFKQFTIYQDKCAMKVSTDACIFGAMLSTKIINAKALDIGSGTGLLSLMLAQKNPTIQIDAVEINENAYAQSLENIAKSNFANQIKIHCIDIKNYTPNYTYDFIFSNPPFFENDLQSSNLETNIAKHSTALTLKNLIHYSKKLLYINGQIAIIIPTHRSTDLEKYAEDENLFLQSKIKIQHLKNKNFTKEIHYYGNQKTEIIIEDFCIKTEDNIYTDTMLALMKDFYL